MLGLVSSLFAGRIPGRYAFWSDLFMGLMFGTWVPTFVGAGVWMFAALDAQGAFQAFWVNYFLLAGWVVLVAGLTAFIYLKALGLGYQMERRAHQRKENER
jgi:hypothetical protein